ncbi:Rieske (2Fe-2S) protein [Streptomyces sannanensis]|uniref:Cytochrome bc1 complex Rieske iron-sulfur subunit n=1 Tax=Streptomyces sannanensis TaxID=285536 RepID=A0ABP6S661_9ACTN
MATEEGNTVMTAAQESERPLGRRTVVAAVGAAGLGVALTACGGSEAKSTADEADKAAAEKPQDTGNGAAQQPLAKTADIPVGGGKVFAAEGVVVTQPAAGDFKAFSSKCTHQGCAVKDVVGDSINCPCHDSKFSAADGSVKAGPATRPLPTMAIKVEGDTITLG